MVFPRCRRLAAALISGALAIFSQPARADAPSPEKDEHKADPLEVRGIEEPPRYSDDAARSVGNWILFLPRNLVDYPFRGTELAANLVADRQLVPRYREILGKPGVDLFVFPTLFAETGAAASIGLRMVFDSPRFATSQRIGYGGPRQVEVDSRVVFKGRSARLPLLISFEAYYKLQDNREYHGIGIAPRLDARNHFREGKLDDFGFYTERRARAIGSLGLRLTNDLEFFLSTSVYRRQIRPTESKEDRSIEAVFDPRSIAGLGNHNPWMFYSEIAARFDTRVIRTRPSPGVLLEGYLGGGHSLYGASVGYMRMGTRVAGYIPLYRRSNILSPRLVLDRVQPLNGLDLPFYELARQPDYRGYDYRTDFVSIVASVDYTWQLVPAIGMRVFFDAATVAPGVTHISLEQFKHLRYAGGVGIDLYAGKSTLANIALSASSDGVRVVGNIGNTSSYGDRQHRD